MFHLPAAVSCSPNVRLYQTDSSYVSLGDIYDLHCEEQGFSREEPMLFVGEKVRKVLRDYRQQSSKKQVRKSDYLFLLPLNLFQPTKVEYVTLKKDTCDEVSAKMVPDDVLSNVGPFPPQSSCSAHSINDLIVHVPDHGRFLRAMENAEAVCFANRCLQLHDLRVLPVQ